MTAFSVIVNGGQMNGLIGIKVYIKGVLFPLYYLLWLWMCLVGCFSEVRSGGHTRGLFVGND